MSAKFALVAATLRASARRQGFGDGIPESRLVSTYDTRENLAFPLVARGRTQSTSAVKVAQVAGNIHITHLLDKAPAQLSGGERQRVA